MKYFFKIGYLGSAYHGWQIQRNATGVQEIINDRLGKLLNGKVKTTGSGRTDAGVHALCQYFHMETQKPLDTEKILFKMNTMLPDDIAVFSIRRVKEDASARYDAISRSYIYRISRVKNPFLKGLSYQYYKPLNIDAMNESAKLLLGRHDFQAFSRVKTQVNHFICNVEEAFWFESNDILEFYIRADRFLRGMVRAIVGTTLMAGENKIKPSAIRDIMESHNRRKAGRAVPAEGLYLENIVFPENIFLDI